MPLDTLIAADPLLIPAKSYDAIWVEEIVVAAPDPAQPVTARVRLRRFCAADGTLEPNQGQWVEVQDVLTGAEADAELAAVVSSLMAYVAKVGVERGIVAEAQS
jgi:hypothetical protein